MPTISHALAVNGLPGERLVLEITEAALAIARPARPVPESELILPVPADARSGYA